MLLLPALELLTLELAVKFTIKSTVNARSHSSFILPFAVITMVFSSSVNSTIRPVSQSEENASEDEFESVASQSSQLMTQHESNQEIFNADKSIGNFQGYVNWASDYSQMPVYVRISKDSWESYKNFKDSTCRKDDEDDRVLYNINMSNQYFVWEERMFHLALREILMPASKGNTRNWHYSILNDPAYRNLDSRIYINEQENLCRSTFKDHDKKAQEREEQDLFEDFLINKVIHPGVMYHQKQKHTNTDRPNYSAN